MSINKDFRLFLFEKIFQFFNDLKKTLLKSATQVTTAAASTSVAPFSSASNSLLSSTTINYSQKSDCIDAEILSIMHILHSIKTDRAIARDLVKLLKVSL